MVATKARGRLGSRSVVTEEAVSQLTEKPVVEAVALVGSRARGNFVEASDVDLFVITNRRVTSRGLREGLPPRLSDPMNLIVRTTDALPRMAAAGSVFLVHVRNEGKVIHDPRKLFDQAFDALSGVAPDTQREKRRRIASLRLYRHLDRFGGDFLFPLSDLYGIAKGIAIADSVERGTPTFVKTDALRQLGDARPELREAVQTVERIKPFYEVVHGHADVELPFSRTAARDEVSRALRAVEQIAEASV